MWFLEVLNFKLMIQKEVSLFTRLSQTALLSVEGLKPRIVFNPLLLYLISLISSCC